MEQDFEKIFDLSYEKRFTALTKMCLRNDDFNLAVFAFGLVVGTEYNKREPLGFVFPPTSLPWLQNFSVQWEFEELRKTQNATDSVYESAEFPRGILFLIGQIDNCVSLGFSELSFFYLVGEAIGYVNSGLIRSDEFIYSINELPKCFIKKEGFRIERVLSLFYFSEHMVLFNKKNNLFEFVFT